MYVGGENAGWLQGDDHGGVKKRSRSNSSRAPAGCLENPPSRPQGPPGPQVNFPFNTMRVPKSHSNKPEHFQMAFRMPGVRNVLVPNCKDNDDPDPQKVEPEVQERWPTALAVQAGEAVG